MMRVSANTNDPGFVKDFMFYEVYCDGVKLEMCFTADDEDNEAFCYIDMPDNQGIAVKKHEGKIEIRKVEN